MREVFDFRHTYAGTMVLHDKRYPCSLSFPDSKIVFKVITEGHGLMEDRGLVEFNGYISTELGIMNFRTIRAYQIRRSTSSNIYSNEHFVANALMVSHVDNNIFLNKFAKMNIIYGDLRSIGQFLDINPTDFETDTFIFKPTFKNILFYQNNKEVIRLENPVFYNYSASLNVPFSVSIEPFFDFVPNTPVGYDDLGPLVKSLGWFLQLLYDSKQFSTDLILYEHEENSDDKANELPYYVFNTEIISAKSQVKSKKSGHAQNGVEKTEAELRYSFAKWWNLETKHRTLYRIFFNEINSEIYSIDDRFKNFCSVIQGLEMLGTTANVPDVKNSMNKKLRNATDAALTELLNELIAEKPLHKLYEIISDQRDYYQHLNKPLKMDLNDNPTEFLAVNGLLHLIIKYHLFKAVEYPQHLFSIVIKRDLGYIQSAIRSLEKRIKTKFSLP
jgi:hypothetical protein